MDETERRAGDGRRVVVRALEGERIELTVRNSHSVRLSSQSLRFDRITALGLAYDILECFTEGVHEPVTDQDVEAIAEAVGVTAPTPFRPRIVKEDE